MSAVINEELAIRIKDLVCHIFELDADELTQDSDFVSDHGVDSMGAIELLANLEREFDIEIEQGQLTRMTTLSGVITVVAEASGW
jgi:acyl carrier protein